MAVHIDERKDCGDDTFVRTEFAQSIIGSDIHNGTLVAAVFISHGEDMWEGVNARKIQKSNNELRAVGSEGRPRSLYSGGTPGIPPRRENSTGLRDWILGRLPSVD
jgi:hypothetical protein